MAWKRGRARSHPEDGARTAGRPTGVVSVPLAEAGGWGRRPRAPGLERHDPASVEVAAGSETRGDWNVSCKRAKSGSQQECSSRFQTEEDQVLGLVGVCIPGNSFLSGDMPGLPTSSLKHSAALCFGAACCLRFSL